MFLKAIFFSSTAWVYNFRFLVVLGASSLAADALALHQVFFVEPEGTLPSQYRSQYRSEVVVLMASTSFILIHHILAYVLCLIIVIQALVPTALCFYIPSMFVVHLVLSPLSAQYFTRQTIMNPPNLHSTGSTFRAYSANVRILLVQF